MASCDDDFSLLGDDSNANYHSLTCQHPTTSTIHTPLSQFALKDKVNDGKSHAGDYENAAACAFSSNLFGSGTDQTDVVRSEATRKYLYLLDAYLDKFTQLNRGNLRGRDWEEVATIVSEKCERQRKSIKQCKNKVDNLKERYKLERQRMSSGSVSANHWPWFQKMEQIVGNSVAAKATSDNDKGVSSLGNTPRQSKISKWRRVIFKISSVALAGTAPNNVDSMCGLVIGQLAMLFANEVALGCCNYVEVAILVGGRNFFCGDAWVTATGLDRIIESAPEKMRVQTRVQAAFSMHEIDEPYSRQWAIRHLEKCRVAIFAGIGVGTGNHLFTTDTAASLRALEKVVLKGTNADGVYDYNSQDNNFTFYHISMRELVTRDATSIDTMTLTFCEENGVPIVVFNLLEPGNISKALCGEQVGTLIDQTGRIS
ncbi:hypothetical protein D8674_008530 [Pyrus ussuriensis x Pyrus communis]|uniref:Myb/SANT-like DNA-binding domain-containing protein n=1 Tax=Pyrus ussuriensis x Pyrus communis TaxID=2448454 RepID=A0A5N5HXP4_9ROSA|nr:hypothetical protein D8674_008530 [Pyrus ussuriensis x Pyrus communis]